MEIIPGTSSHYERLVTFANTLEPERNLSVANLEAADKHRDSKSKFQRWIAVNQDEVVGLGNYSQSIWFAHPQKFIVWIEVLPGYREQGIGSALYDSVMNGLHPFDPIALRTTVKEDQPHGIRFLEKRGFREVIRDIPSELDVQSFDLTRFEGLEDRFQDSGIVIKNAIELENDPDRDQKLYELDWELSMSVPGDLAAGMGRRGLDKYVEYALTGSSAILEGFSVTVKGDEYIGLSHILVSKKGIALYQGLTGVKPEYRHLGIGLAMKVRGIKYAKAHGYATLLSENDAKNIPMLKMNERLGFVRKPDSITFEKQCQSM